MIKYLGAVAALALWSGAAEARVVTIEYATTTGILGGDVSGRFTFDTRTAFSERRIVQGIETANYGGSPTWVHTFDLFGEVFTRPMFIQISDQFFGDLIQFFSEVPGIPVSVAFTLQYGVGARPTLDLPETGYEDAVLSAVTFYGVSGPISGDLARYSVSYANSVPEPATWAMMIGGIGMVGGALRRRSRNALAAAA
ncbi:PEPxxWA-CTERM sorting domain-containing protein [Microvirga sp. SRT01]|uniref:PEPxxWA-CTERM sorting domain-containing protein n=1 Tax=Sphingomonas longa TaxID=2778730 RepID=A0ABS2D7E9_9SPHN|nr:MULTISPECIES: PEPxxWA-CTERM sorting domain-containing protein [Alphaproteobacteria]MBM6576863.1 PEPxxWA-CTERM sorting domain-containing protein [Sphingomonas sp. BT552]MBR7709907.1 PEPxxWA-CTERM sorting domain-containing protein [Microvirga sp. SRT01]